MDLAREIIQAKATLYSLGSELELARMKLQDLETVLVRQVTAAHLKQSELEMALDLAQSKAMAKE
jgi:hypothetical protein